MSEQMLLNGLEIFPEYTCDESDKGVMYARNVRPHDVVVTESGDVIYVVDVRRRRPYRN